MTPFEIGSLIVSILAWLVTLIIQCVVLARQSTFQKQVAELTNNLGARREIASKKLDYISSMTDWLEEGLDIYNKIVPVDDFIKDRAEHYLNPNPDWEILIKRHGFWSNSADKLIILAEIYDPEFKNKSYDWSGKHNEELPDDLPRLLGAFRKCVESYFWMQRSNYLDFMDDSEYPNPPDEEEEEFFRGLILNSRPHIIPLYQRIHIALERVKEFVVTNPLRQM